MEIKEGHLAKADSNEEFLSSFNLENSKFLDWAITVMFYAALHYVDAYLATRGIYKINGHPERRKLVEKYLTPIYKAYSSLNIIGEYARYEIDFKITPAFAKEIKTRNYAYIKSYITAHLK